jgi:hypothetical protein
MDDQDRNAQQPNVDVQNATTMAAQVNAPARQTIYSEDGMAVDVPLEDVQYWLSKLVKADPRTALDEALVHLRAIEPAMQSFVDTALGDGYIDRNEAAEFATVQTAVARFNEAWSQVVNAVTVLVPLSEDVPVVAVRGDGVETQVDPNQVEEYRAQGFKIARAKGGK